jgi:putative membrane protein
MARNQPAAQSPPGSPPSEGRPTAQSAAQRLLIAHWAAVVLTVIAVVFILQNRAEVSVDLFWLKATAPLWFVLVGTLVLGLLVGVLGSRRRPKTAPGAATPKK